MSNTVGALSQRLLASILAMLSLFALPAVATEVNVYSARKEALIKPLLDRYAEQAGVTVNLVTGKGEVYKYTTALLAWGTKPNSAGHAVKAAIAAGDLVAAHTIHH